MDLPSLVGYFRESGHPLLTQEADQQEGLEYLKRLENLIAEKRNTELSTFLSLRRGNSCRRVGSFPPISVETPRVFPRDWDYSCVQSTVNEIGHRPTRPKGRKHLFCPAAQGLVIS